MAHDQTAAAIAAGWKAEAAEIRREVEGWAQHASARKILAARADQLDECAARLMTDLHAGPGPRPDPEQVKTVWRSPSGLLHQRRTCSGAGPRARVAEVTVTREEFWAAQRCRCLPRFRPDAAAIVASAAPGAAFRDGYSTGNEDAARGIGKRPADDMPAAWARGYQAGYDDAVAARAAGVRLR